MRVRFLSPTNIRVSSFDHHIPPIGMIHAGVEIEVENRLYSGMQIESTDSYFKDQNGWFYWSGRSVILYKALPPPDTSSHVAYEEVGGIWQFEPFRKEDLFDGSKKNIDKDLYEIEPDNFTTSPEEIIHQSRFNNRNVINFSLKNRAIDQLNIDDLFWKSNNLLGQGIRVMLMSTGIDTTLRDFESRIEKVVNFCIPQENIEDTDGSGTACAGILCGSGNENWLGAAPEAKLLIGKTMQSTLDFDVHRVMEALAWCEAEKPDVLLFCFDFRADAVSQVNRAEIAQKIEFLVSQGVLCIAPIGDGSLGSRMESRWPGSLDFCLSVGAYDSDRRRSKASLRSYNLDIMAPGEDLLPHSFNGRIGVTAQAAAFTAGIAALCMSYTVRESIPMDVKNWIKMFKQTAIPKFERTKCSDMEYGCGYINPEGILDSIRKFRS